MTDQNALHLDLVTRSGTSRRRFEVGQAVIAGWTSRDVEMFGGTLAAMGGIHPADRFEFELVDERLDRRIVHACAIEPLPIAG